jgi:hypothetical protein
VGQIVDQGAQQVVIDLRAGLAVDARRASARVVTDAFRRRQDQPRVMDQLVELAKTFGRVGGSELAEMFKLAFWVAHKVYHLRTQSGLNADTCGPLPCGRCYRLPGGASRPRLLRPLCPG